jgi:riboflavin kinase/FMN adenylyltransferase
VSVKHLVTIGTFDGVHRGHRRVLDHLLRKARALGMSTTAVVFDVPPRSVLNPGVPVQLLTTPEERVRLMRAAGVDVVRVLRFGGGLARTPHTRFFNEFLVGECSAGGILVGPDFAFGRHRRGDADWLRAACRRRGLHFSTPPLLTRHGEKVSSSHIRTLLVHGKVAEAAKLLGRPYALSGAVVRGLGLGTRIGIPTANMDADPRRLLPRGVYAVRARVGGKGRWHPAVCNIGTKPTLGGEGRVSVETHIPGFKADIYGRELELRFIAHLRGERRFPSLGALVRRIRRDCTDARRILGA